jgi:hypothetical protein
MQNSPVLTHFIEDHDGPRGFEDGKSGNRGLGCCFVSTWRQLPHLKDVSAFFNRGQLKCGGTRAQTRFRLSAKRTSLFKSVGSSVQSTTGMRSVRISGSNAGYTMFRGSVKSTGYPLHSPVFPFTSPPVRHRVPSRCNWTLPPRTPLTYVIFTLP